MNFNVDFENILFLDIETVPQHASWNEVSVDMQMLFEKKTKYQRKEEFTPEQYYDRAGIWAEFGKIVCISVGYFSSFDAHREFRVKSFCGNSERKILLDFKTLCDTYFNEEKHRFCAHNGKEFDYPYLSRRMIIHGIELPNKLNLFGRKPWEVNHLDTLELWKFGDYKHFTSLNLLTNILGIPSPKADIDGSEVGNVYYRQNDMERIVGYCEKDTIAVVQVLLRLNSLPLLSEEEITTI